MLSMKGLSTLKMGRRFCTTDCLEGRAHERYAVEESGQMDVVAALLRRYGAMNTCHWDELCMMIRILLRVRKGSSLL